MKRLALLLALTLPAAAGATPKIQHWTLDNGARVLFVEAHELPMVELQLLFDAGSARDPEGRSGLAAMTNALLREGAGDLDGERIAADLEDLGAGFGVGAQRDSASVSLRTLADHQLLARATGILNQMLRTPNFPERALERERKRALVGLRQALQNPAEVGNRALFAGLYGTHPYARDPAGDEAGISALTRKDLVEFHQRYYVARNAVLAIVGDLSAREARALSDRLLDGLPAGAPAPELPAPADPAARAAGETRIAHDSAQTHLLVAQVAIARTDPDYFPLLVGNYILGGGGLVSRLSNEIREKRGLAYSSYSYFHPSRAAGPYILGLQTQNGQYRQALEVLRTTLREFVEQGPTEAELAAARKHLSGGFPLRIDSNRKIADHLAAIGFYRLPYTYLDEYITRVESVTLAQVRDAFKRRVHPQHMLTVIVGGAGS